MKFTSVIVALLLSCLSVYAAEKTVSEAKTSSHELLLPSSYRKWVTVSPSALGIAWHRQRCLASTLFVEPSAFEHFTRTGVWPDKTVIVLELSSAHAPRNKSALMGLEAAVKNSKGLQDPWTFYGIIFDHPQQQNVKRERRAEGSKPLDIRLAIAFPTLRAMINAKPSAMSDTVF